MRPGILAALAAATLLLGLAALAAPSARAEVLSAGNGIYTVQVERISGPADGEYGADTGPSHPLGNELELLTGPGGDFKASFGEVFDYASKTEYVLPEQPSTTVPAGSTGFQTTYKLLKPSADLEVVQTVRAVGTTYEDSRVEVTMVVKNTGATPLTVGVAYLWNLLADTDPGPTFQADEPTGSVLVEEATFTRPAFDHYTIEENDSSPAPPTYDVLGTVNGPAAAGPTPPTLLEYANWPEAEDSSTFPFETLGEDIAGPASRDDSAVLYYWGDTEADAHTIPGGGSYAVSASLYLTAVGAGVPGVTSPPGPTPTPLPGPGPTPTPTPPAVTITSGPARETTAATATFKFKGVAGGSYECSLDGGRWRRCASGQSYGHIAPGDHRFQVRETLAGQTSAPASYQWTVDLPRACVLRTARARVFVYTKHDKVRLVIRYKSYRPAHVTVSYTLAGSRGGLKLGSASATLKKKGGLFRLPEHLSAARMREVRAARHFTVRFHIPKTPRSCGRLYSKRLTIPRRISGQTVWFQSDSRFARGK